MRTKLLLTTLVLTFALSVCASFAQPFDDDMRMIRHKRSFMNIPDLTEDQISKIQKLRLEHQKEMLPIKTKLQSKQLELRTMILEESDQKNIETKIEDIGQIRTEMMKKRMAHRLQIRDLLTDKQKVHFDTMGFGRHDRHGRGMGHKGFDGPGSKPCNRW